MTIPGPELQQRIRRIEHGLSQVGTLLVPVEISDGVKKAITLANIDPDMALGRARKVLDFIIADLYKREFGRAPGTQPLENSVQQLAKAGKLPRTMVAYANSVRELGNVGIHGSGEAITEEDVVSSLENLMRLVAWYCEQVRPGGEGKIEPEPPPIKDGNIAERERADKERAEKERAEKERADKERAEKERAEKERAEKERADKERAEKERLEKEKEKQQKKPPRPSRKPIVVVLLAACVLGGALWWWLEASPAARHKEFLKHKYDGIALLKSGNYADARTGIALRLLVRFQR